MDATRYRLTLSPGGELTQIGSDGGLLAAPVVHRALRPGPMRAGRAGRRATRRRLLAAANRYGLVDVIAQAVDRHLDAAERSCDPLRPAVAAALASGRKVATAPSGWR